MSWIESINASTSSLWGNLTLIVMFLSPLPDCQSTTFLFLLYYSAINGKIHRGKILCIRIRNQNQFYEPSMQAYKNWLLVFAPQIQYRKTRIKKQLYNKSKIEQEREILSTKTKSRRKDWGKIPRLPPVAASWHVTFEIPGILSQDGH